MQEAGRSAGRSGRKCLQPGWHLLKALKKAGLRENAKTMQERVFKSGSYEEALSIMGEYVHIH